MAELKLTEEEKEQKSYLSWDDEALGKFVKKKAIDVEDYFGEETAEMEAALIILLSRVVKRESEMVMMEVKGLTVDGEDLGQWKITFEKTDPDVPGGINSIDDDPDNNNDGQGGILVP